MDEELFADGEVGRRSSHPLVSHVMVPESAGQVLQLAAVAKTDDPSTMAVLRNCCAEMARELRRSALAVEVTS